MLCWKPPPQKKYCSLSLSLVSINLHEHHHLSVPIFFISFFLLIDEAERRLANCINEVLNWPWLSKRRQVEQLRNLNLVAGRLVHHSPRTCDILTVLEVKVLPDKVHAVDLAMVLEERRLKRREVKITTGIASDGKVATAVDSHAEASRLGVAHITLHNGLEELDVGRIGDDRRRVPKRGVLSADATVQVSLDAPRVIFEGAGAGGRPEVYGVVGEGTLHYAAATATAAHTEAETTSESTATAGTSFDGFSITAERGFGAIEEGGLCWVVAVKTPLPVREITY